MSNLGDLPAISTMAGYSGMTYGGLGDNVALNAMLIGKAEELEDNPLDAFEDIKAQMATAGANLRGAKGLMARQGLQRRVQAQVPFESTEEQQPKQNPNMNQKRLVRVFLADPDPKVPADQSLLEQTGEKLTESTDQELFFELNVKESLENHNLKRAKILDKEATKRSEKDVFLEPIKIRDLKMTVVAIATF